MASRRIGRALVWRLRLVLIVLCMVGMAIGPAQNWPLLTAAAPANTEAADDLGDTLPANLLHDGQLTGFRSSGLYTATPAQRAALTALQGSAISAVIRDHGLTAADRAAVQAWARSEAEAEFFLQILLAIKTPAPARTADQQRVVEWVTAVQQRQNQRAAEAAGIEYVRWAGLNEAAFRNLIRTNVGAGVLTDFLDDDLYSGSATGYCQYHPPAPFDTNDEYGGRGVQQCFTNCTNLLGCDPPTPSYDQFIKWGSASANYQIANSAEFTQAANTIATAVTVGAGAGIGTAALVGTAGIVAGSASGAASAFALAFFPYSAVVAPGVAVAGAASLVLIVVLAIVIAVLQGITVFNAAALPGQLANLIAAATNDTPDLNAVIGSPQGLQSLFALFVGATLPTPRVATCDNSIDGAGVVPCLNAPPIPAAGPTDPLFSIQAQGAATTTPARSLTWRDTVANTTTTARLHGNWFVTQVNGGDIAQSLRLQYTDWDSKQQIVWLLGNPTDGYTFLGVANSAQTGTPVDPATCVAADTCFASPRIEYVGTDGANYTAAVIAAPRPVVAPTVDPPSPRPGQVATFRANGSSPAGAGIAYECLFQTSAQPQACAFEEREGVYVYVCSPTGPEVLNICELGLGSGSFGPCFGNPVPGDTVTRTFSLAEPYAVKLVATDAFGRKATAEFTVNVTKATVAVGWPAPVAITYGTPLGATQLAATANQPGTFAYSIAGSPVAAGAILPAGSYAVQAQFIPSGPGYAVPEPLAVTLVVNKAPLTVRAGDATRVYGVANPPLTGVLTGVVDGDTITASYGTAAVAGSPVGIYAIVPTLADPGGKLANYAVTSADGTLLVTGAPLTVTATDKRIIYGEVLPAFDATFAGFVNGDTAAVVSGLTCAPAGISAGTHAIACRGASAANYAITYTLGTLTVVPTIAVAGGGAGMGDTGGRLNLTLGDSPATVGDLSLRATSSNPALVPVGNVTFGGVGAQRTATIATVGGATGRAVVTITAGEGAASTSVTITVIVGGNGKDTLTGTDGADLILGGNGDDTLVGGAGNDILVGGKGDDTLTGGGGADTFDGGQGTDRATDFTPAEGDIQANIP